MKLYNLRPNSEAAQSKLSDISHDWIATSHSPPLWTKGRSASILPPLQRRWEKQNKFKDAISCGFIACCQWMTHYSEKQKKKKKKKNGYDCCSKPQEGCGYVLATHLRFIWKGSAYTPCWNISGKTATVRGKWPNRARAEICRYIQSQNPSCSALINPISVASKSS